MLACNASVGFNLILVLLALGVLLPGGEFSILVEQIADHTASINEKVEKMIDERKKANKIDSERERAIAYHDHVAPMIEEVRSHIDKLELIVDDQMWILPKYRELLFLR